MVYLPRAESLSSGRAGPLNAHSLATQIVDIASDKQASDIVLLDIRPVSLIADYFVVCTSASDRQTGAIVRDITDMLREEHGVRPIRVEGASRSGWVLMDYGDVVVHIFGADQRAYYRLEELWSAAIPLVRVQ